MSITKDSELFHAERAAYDASDSSDENNGHTTLQDIMQKRPVKPWSRGSLQLYAICLLIYLCSTMNGQWTFTSEDCSRRANKRKATTLRSWDRSTLCRAIPHTTTCPGKATAAPASSLRFFKLDKCVEPCSAGFQIGAVDDGRSLLAVSGSASEPSSLQLLQPFRLWLGADFSSPSSRHWRRLRDPCTSSKLRRLSTGAPSLGYTTPYTIL